MNSRAAVRNPLDLWRLALAVVALRAIDRSLRRRGFAATHERARLAARAGADGAAALHVEEAERLAQQVALAARLARVRCLPRSLLLYTWLGRAGAPVRLCIGVRRQAGGVLAHAWVVWQEPGADARPLGEAPTVAGDFAVLRGGLADETASLRASDFAGA